MQLPSLPGEPKAESGCPPGREGPAARYYPPCPPLARRPNPRRGRPEPPGGRPEGGGPARPGALRRHVTSRGSSRRHAPSPSSWAAAERRSGVDQGARCFGGELSRVPRGMTNSGNVRGSPWKTVQPTCCERDRPRALDCV